MNNCLKSSVIHINDLHLWAHVGVLDNERVHGQLFSLDFSLWLNLDDVAKNDQLIKNVDYSLAILDIQQLSFDLNCMTIEYFGDLILDRLEALYGSVPMKIFLRKCQPPVSGFSGSGALERQRNFDVH